MAEATEHGHMRTLAGLEVELLEYFPQVGLTALDDCWAYCRAKADHCLSCQDVVLAEAAADPVRAAHLFYLFQVLTRGLVGLDGLSMLALNTPGIAEPFEKIMNLVAECGESTVIPEVMVESTAVVLAEETTEGRERCLQAWANTAGAAKSPMMQAAVGAVFDDRIDFEGKAPWLG